MKKLIIANWKMNPASLKEAKDIFNATKKSLAGLKNAEVVVCPPSIYIAELADKAAKVGVGAQNVFYEDGKRSHTGEISAKMLKSIGAKYVIIGHSERRTLGETDEVINRKILAALEAGLKVVFCAGEETRDAENQFYNVVKGQITEGLRGINQNLLKNIVLAYEPVWAISSNSNAKADNPGSVFEISVLIRKILMEFAGGDLARKIPIIYGGSVNAENAEKFIKEGGVDGLLVGSKSLNKEEFRKILSSMSS
ncbi:triose-phosphate isomerase [Candidatus Parcubacteria bacterium]|nr:MAG: triose-phosphate isomerase [Candidatus Parcubacteria bacterium]